MVGTKKWNLKWTDIHQNVFGDIIKSVMTKEKIPNHPKVGKPFDIHTDTSDTQLEVVIDQDGMFSSSYSRK